MDGSLKLVPVAELEPAPDLAEMTPNEFRVALTRRRLEHPLTDQLLSYRASKTKLYYHQFLPVKKMLESPDQRLLIADEVGTVQNHRGGTHLGRAGVQGSPRARKRLDHLPQVARGKVARGDASAFRLSA